MTEMPPPPNAAAIVVHDRAQVEGALAAARALGMPVVLWSPAGAGAFMGATYFQAMIAPAEGRQAGADFTGVLDCGERAGDALGALRQGIEAVCFVGPSDVADRLHDIAQQASAQVIRARPEALDLVGVDDVEGACRTWLQHSVDAGAS